MSQAHPTPYDLLGKGQLDGADLASALVKPFRLEQLAPRAAPRLVALARRYGVDWWRSVLGTWAADRRDSAEWQQGSWTMSVPALCRQLCAGESKTGSSWHAGSSTSSGPGR